MARFQIIHLPGNCLLLTVFHSVGDTHVAWINFESNLFNILFELLAVKDRGNKHSVQSFEHPYMHDLLLSFNNHISGAHSWTNLQQCIDQLSSYLHDNLSPFNSMSVCTNAFGTSAVIRSLFYFASITPVAMMASDAAVGLDASSRAMCARCVLPFGQNLALTLSSLFSFRKIRLSIALFLLSAVISSTLIGSKTNQSFSSVISLLTAAMPLSPNFLTPCFKLYVCRKLHACESFIPAKAVL
jgi:hypothetical protein